MGTGHKPGLPRTYNKRAKKGEPSNAAPQKRVAVRAPDAGPIGREEFVATCLAANGDMKIMAEMLDLAYQSIRSRFAANPDLMIIRNQARLDLKSDILLQAEDNIHRSVIDGNVADSWKLLGIRNPKEWAEVERSETTVIHTTPQDLEAFDRADSNEIMLIEEKQRSQELADEVRRLKSQLALPSPSSVVDAEVIEGSSDAP